MIIPAVLLREAADRFNGEHYREALLIFEAQWIEDRSEFLRALILLCNALNQLRLGLTGGPSRNLASAAALLEHYPHEHGGFDVAALRAYIAALRERLAQASGPLDWEQVPRLKLQHSAVKLPRGRMPVA